MLSKIQIDIDADNQPVIKIEYRASEDVRDKMVKRFMETFGGESWFASFNFHQHKDNGDCVALVRPIPIKDFKYHVADMIEKNDRYQKAIASMADPLPPAYRDGIPPTGTPA